MENELRILNGLHRGAVLPLDDSTLLLGAHEDADVVMVDPGIVPHHASLQPSDGGWMLTSDAGPVYSADMAEPQALVDLWSGSFFRIGETWLVISEPGEPWQSLPAMPLPDTGVDALPVSYEDDDLPVENAIHSDAQGRHNALEEAGHVPQVVSDQQEVPTIQTAPVAALKPPRLWRNWMAIPASLLVAMSAVAAYAYTAKPSMASLHAAPGFSAAMSTPVERPVAATERPVATAERMASGAVVARMALPAPLSPEELRTAFRKRMKDAELLKQFDLDLNDESWSMRAHLDDAESARFERILKSFVNEHKISFPINAKVGNAESMLPFSIQQVVSGANAGIVTDTGDRFYVGEEFQGVRLVSIVENRLTFMGKRKIEVIW